MFAQVHCLQSLPSDDLDRYLSQGWFRMGQTIFTTNFLSFNRQLYSAIWLRVDLQRYEGDKTQEKLFRLNADFSVTFKPMRISPEIEILYARYRESITFEGSASIQQLLFRDSQYNIYNTIEVNVRDGEKLIACGFFDMGKTSAAGIISFYDPDYRKYSLGKYIIYLKMQYCRKLGLRYFYPGYFVPGYFSFDYKLAIGRAALEYLELSTNRWKSINEFDLAESPLNVMQDRLITLMGKLHKADIPCYLLRYEFFDVNLVPDLSAASFLFDFPILLYLGSGEGGADPVIVYDVRDQQYHLMKCRVINNPGGHDATDDNFFPNVLMREKEVCSASDEAEILKAVVSEVNRMNV